MNDYVLLSNPLEIVPVEERDPHRSPPTPSSDCLYGLVGDIARAGSAQTEANPFAIALNAMVYIGCGLGRAVHMLVGDTAHHPRLFATQVGRSGLGRKGDALSLCRRLHAAVDRRQNEISPGVHSGGLSTREGLIHLIHDGYLDGKNEVPAVQDKRLYVIESEFSNVLHQTRREGNTLSPALRDLWDGGCLKPATKSSRVGVAEPHVCISAGITPSELRSLISNRELLNGFANRFIIIWAERTRVIPFPEPTHVDIIELLVTRIIDTVEFSEGNQGANVQSKLMTLSPSAKKLYADLYVGELGKQANNEILNTLLERRAPVLLRIAMILAATDLTHEIQERHIHAATAWIRYWSDSVEYIFTASDNEDGSIESSETAVKIMQYLTARVDASRTDLTTECFGGHVSKQKIDLALDRLLSSAPPTVLMTTIPRKSGPGSPTKRYRLAANSASGANSDFPGLTTQALNQSAHAKSAKPDAVIDHISHDSHEFSDIADRCQPAENK